jgi:lipoate-protein ligase A
VSIAARLLEIGLPADASVGHIYDHLSAIFVQAFALVGVDGARGACGRSPALHSGNCMATVTRADVVERATGAKLLGAALLRRSDAILLQCTIPVAAEHWSHSISPDSIFRPGAPDGAAPRTVSSAPAAAGELRAAIVQALTALFGREPAGTAVTDDEAAQVARRAGEHIVEV